MTPTLTCVPGPAPGTCTGFPTRKSKSIIAMRTIRMAQSPMRNKQRISGLLVAGGMLLATPAAMLAHHSFAAEYDAKKPITLKGTVTKVEWMNPHVYFYIDVEEEGG